MVENIYETISELVVNQHKIINHLQYLEKIIQSNLGDSFLPDIAEGDSSFQPIEKRNADIGILYPSGKFHLYYSVLLEVLASYQKESVIFFTIEDLDIVKQSVRGIWFSKGVKEICISAFPPVIYNFALLSKNESIKKMRYLRTLGGRVVINPINNFNQDEILDILGSFSQTKPFLLPYQPLSVLNLEKFLREGRNLYLIPKRALQHPAGIFLSKVEEGGVVVKLGSSELKVSNEEIYPYLRKITRGKQYLLMKGIETMSYNGFPIECRVYVQKSANKKWNLVESIVKSEIFAKSSIYMGECDSLNKSLYEIDKEKRKELESKLAKYALETVTILDFFLPNIGSFKLDFTIDKSGNPYLLYIGGYEQSDFLYKITGDKWKEYIQGSIDLAHSLFLERYEKERV